jgi:hypothetical protein
MNDWGEETWWAILIVSSVIGLAMLIMSVAAPHFIH